MLETTKEDKIKSKIATELNSLEEFNDLSEYYREFNKRYEEVKYQEKTDDTKKQESHETRIHRLISKLFSYYTFRRIHRDSLEAKLSNIAQEYSRALEKSRRTLDNRAYKTIMWCQECKKDKRLVKYYYRDFYYSLREYYISKNDLSNGRIYIEEKEETYNQPIS